MGIKKIITENFSFLMKMRALFIKNTYLGKLYLKREAAIEFHRRFKRKLDWNNPQDLNEKIQWLKFNSDTSLWTKYADKYLVREYVKECGLEDILVKLYGVWDNADDIDFSSLPNSFVLKTNNFSGRNIIIKDNSKIEESVIRETFKKWMQKDNYKISLEPHYLKIPSKIIAEEYLSSGKQDVNSTSLIDYKIWCFNGEPYSIWVASNRTSKSLDMYMYDLNWNNQFQHCVFTDRHLRCEIDIPRPEVLGKMIIAARKLSKDIPQVRVDFYVVDNQLFFGEMTFTSTGGYMHYLTQEYLLEMGSKVILSK